MSNKVDIFLLDITNNIIEEKNIIKPNTFQDLLISIKNNFKQLPESFNIFYQSSNNNEIIVNNNEKYKSIGDILFIRKSEQNNLDKSVFSLNYDKLSESKQDILDEKYNCSICFKIIKNENPLFCYICQKNFHKKCLEDWDKKSRLKNLKLSCPNCRNELPLEQWKPKLDFEDNRKNDAEMINLLLNKNNNNNNNNIIDELKNENIKLKEKYDKYIEKTFNIFKNIFTEFKEINSLLKINKINNNLNIFTGNVSINEFILSFDKYAKSITDIFETIKININKYLNKEPLYQNNNNIFIDNKANNLELGKFKTEINLIYSPKFESYCNIFGEEFVLYNKENIELVIENKKLVQLII